MRVGIIGLGKMGQTRATLCCDLGIEVAAVCDIDPRLAEKFPGVPFYRNYHALLAGDDDLDAVFVCVFNNAAAEIASFGLHMGLHVFCEKPPGRSLKDVDLMRTTEKLCPDQTLMFGFSHRYQQHVLLAKAELGTPRLGRILWISGVYGARGHTGLWRQIQMLSGGGIGLDLGIHMVDLLRWLTGAEFEVVSSMVDRDQTEALVDDNVFALLRSDSGYPVSLHLSATMTPTFSVEIGMSKGYVRIVGLCTSSDRFTPALFIACPVDASPSDPMVVREFYMDRSFRTELEIFRRAVEGKPHDSDHVSGCTASSEDAWQAMSLVQAIYHGHNSTESVGFPGIDVHWHHRYGGGT